MENLAYIYSSTAYDDPGSGPELRSLHEISSMLPRSAAMTVAGTAMVVSAITHAPAAEAVVRRGDVCDAVEDIQTALNIGVDGVFGPATEAAVIQFQRTEGLTADGLVGPSTAAAMELATAGDADSVYAIGRGCTTAGGGGGSSTAGTLTVATNGADLVVRNGPTPTSTVVRSLANGSVESYVSVSNNWYQLANGGWVSGTWVRPGGTPTGGGPATGGTAGGGGGTTTVTVVNAPSGLLVRSGASSTSSILRSLPNGSSVSITGDVENNFLELTDGGWVSAAFTTYTSGGSSGGATGTGGTAGGSGGGGGSRCAIDVSGATSAVVNTNGGDLIVRNGPTATSEVINFLPDGTRVTLVNESNCWGLLSGGGWVALEWLS